MNPRSDSPSRADRVAGLVLAAGAGTRMGGPKALLRDHAGTSWVRLRALTLAEAGCDPVLASVGAQGRAVSGTIEGVARVVHVHDWASGMGASLRAGIAALEADTDTQQIEALVVVPVDVPGLTAAAVDAVLGAARASGEPLRDALVQALDRATPAHPVLIGRAHWPAVATSAVGDRGARAYLANAVVRHVEVGDLADLTDVDSTQDLARWREDESRRTRPCSEREQP